MALHTIRRRSELAEVYVLAPERYDPRRELEATDTEGVRVGDVATTIRETVQPEEDLGRCLVLDTSDAHEGIIMCRREPDPSGIGSTKKVVRPNEVIISRLRPYLRQVAFVDDSIPYLNDARILCSTEFFVLRSVDNRSIAFLVPFLLSSRVQRVLAASQEGGHHPRFDEATLVNLPIPERFLKDRESRSRAIEKNVRLFRESEAGIAEMVAEAENSFSVPHN